MKCLEKLYQNESGQAVIEYVLVLLISIMVILGALYQLNSAFRVWADNYFGDYLACLLESGEVPALDAGAGSCSEAYRPFSITDGRPLIGKGVDNSSDDSASNSSGGGFNSAAAANAANGRASYMSASRGRYSPANAPGANSGGATTSGSGDGSGSDSSSFGTTDLAGYQQNKVIKIPIRRGDYYGGDGFAREDEKKDKTKISVPVAEEGAAQKGRAQLLKVERRMSSEKPPEIEELSFGGYLRYLIIAAIIIAIVFFVGGQALQVSKSME